MIQIEEGKKSKSYIMITCGINKKMTAIGQIKHPCCHIEMSVIIVHKTNKRQKDGKI